MSQTDTQFFSIDLMLKATPQEEGGQRFIYCEASNETVDAQNEVVLQKALADSMEYMLERGNFDIDHITMVGAKEGIPNYMLFEIGQPLEINFRDGRTFVKGIIYQGGGPAAERANYFWSSLTDISPPQRWFPSVGGSILARDISVDPMTKSQTVAVSKVRWSNIGYSKQPVNQSVPSVSTVPMGVFAKCCTPGGFDLTKALTAGYGTDVATLTDGAALGAQSLDRRIKSTYATARDVMAGRLRPRAIADEFGVSDDEASQWVEQFLRDLHTTREGSHP